MLQPLMALRADGLQRAASRPMFNQTSNSKMLGKGVRIRRALRARGPWGTMAAAVRSIFPIRAKTFSAWRDMVNGRCGLEIGGPSPGFARDGFLPVYPIVGKLDNCNFGSRTVWEGSIEEGETFQFDPQRPKGRQFVTEGDDLSMIPDRAYDFVISSHCIEHIANPLLALQEWKRAVRDEGGILLVIPHKQESFDRRRPITTLDHLIADYKKNTGEDDLTHLDEMLHLHDFDRNWRDADFETLKLQCRENLEYRRIHHHVFNTDLAVAMVDHAGLQIISVEAFKPFHIIIAARKPPPGKSPQNGSFLSPAAEWRRASPFHTDR